MPKSHPYYLMWTGALNLGDTPGVFYDAQFAGLLIQVPVAISFVPDGTGPIKLLLMTSEVEVFNGKTHPVYWDWTPGTPFPNPIGQIDDVDLLPGHPEYHPLSIPAAVAGVGRHTLTIHVNPEVAAGMKDDFVLRRIEAHESIGARIGW